MALYSYAGCSKGIIFAMVFWVANVVNFPAGRVQDVELGILGRPHANEASDNGPSMIDSRHNFEVDQMSLKTSLFKRATQ